MLEAVPGFQTLSSFGGGEQQIIDIMTIKHNAGDDLPLTLKGLVWSNALSRWVLGEISLVFNLWKKVNQLRVCA